MANSTNTIRKNYATDYVYTENVEEDLQPYLSLFMKPLNKRKSAFSKKELQVMCSDPMHSPRLILYLIDFVKEM